MSEQKEPDSDDWFEEGQTATERLKSYAAHGGEVDPALMGFAKIVDREDDE